MVDFNGFDKGVIGKKLPSDSTLNQMKKSELIELLHLAESNHRVLAETYKIAVDTSKCKSCPLTLDEKDRRQVYNQALDDCRKLCGVDRPNYADCSNCIFAFFENDFDTTICKLEQLKK